MSKPIEICDKVKEFRLKRRQTQAEAAADLGVRQATFSDWESTNSDTTPSSESYIRLGNLSPYPNNFWFWKQAGIEEKAITPAVSRLLIERGEMAATKCVAVPPLQADKSQPITPEDFWNVDARLVPNAGAVVHWVVPADFHNKHVPLRTGDVVILDRSSIDASTVQPFLGKIILVEVTGKALEIEPKAMRPHLGFDMGRLGITPHAISKAHHLVMPYVGKLYPFDSPVLYLTPQAASDAQPVAGWRPRHGLSEPEFTPALARKEMQLFPGCSILGRMLFWFRPDSLAQKAARAVAAAEKAEYEEFLAWKAKRSERQEK